jgi:hypothetical protein
MLENFALTLYELFGYLLPGGIALLGFTVLYWTLFVPQLPLGIGGFSPGVALWTGIVVVSYVLGHAAQAVGNKALRSVEAAALAMQGETWMREHSRKVASDLIHVAPNDLSPRWIYRILDEYAVQVGRPGDRDMYIYREGFYRGTCIALFFLSATLLARTVVPGAAIQFAKWRFPITYWQLFITALVLASLGWLFLQRYKRFCDYRVTRAALAALVLQNTPPRDVGNERDPTLE